MAIGMDARFAGGVTANHEGGVYVPARPAFMTTALACQPADAKRTTPGQP
jgi:hypothetical protein